MSRITKVTLNGYKALDREYQLGPATVLSGPNGSGKSACLEAIVYAISGRVPGGKSLDAVAQYFPPRGGHVEIHDEDGNWLRRGISRDLEKAKVSEVLEVSGQKEDEDPDLTAWRASETVLDLREFTGLSPEKRREHVLALLGGGAADPKALYREIATEYAREVLGPAALPQMLADYPRTDDGKPDLPRETWELCDAWTRRLGLDEVLRSHLVAGKTTTELCLKLASVAKESRLGARKAALDAKSAIRELEAEAKGAAAASAQIAECIANTTRIRALLCTAREQRAAVREVQFAKGAATLGLENAQKRFDAAFERFRSLPAAEPAPVQPQRDPRLEEAFARENEALAARNKANEELSAHEQVMAQLATTRRGAQQLTGMHDAHLRSDLGCVVALIAEIPDSCHPRVPELRQSIGLLAEEWSRNLESYRRSLDLLADAERQILDAHPDLTSEYHAELKAAAAAAEVAVKETRQAVAELQETHRVTVGEYTQALSAWNARDAARRQALANLERERTLLEEADQHLRDSEARLAQAAKNLPQDEPIGTVVERLEAELKAAQEAEERARKAQGAADAYGAAILRAESHTVAEAAWKAAERAIATVREKLVGAATAPLLGALNEVLALAGREERAYLELENDRGKPIFELGWTRGDQRIAHPALSAGEAAIFGAGLAIAMALRSPGRRVLLAEADPLDERNLAAFLGALAPWADRLDALVVATASPVPAAAGWEVIGLAEEARV